MKIFFRSVFFLTAIFLSGFCFSQSPYLEGFVVTNNGDSLKGWINYRQWDKNPNAVKFKKNIEADNPTTYRVDDLVLFVIQGRDKYVKAAVTKDMRPVEMSQLVYARDTTVSDTVFLRVLLEGKISLYELNDKKKHFYIREEGKDYQELMYKVYLENNLLSEFAAYREQLNKLTPISKRTDRDSAFLNTIKYNEKDLTNAVEEINVLMGAGSFYNAVKPKEPLSFYVGAGAVYSKLNFSKDEPFVSDLNYSKSVQPVITAGLDVAISRNLHRLFARLELAWFGVNYDGVSPVSSKDTFSYNLKVSNLSTSVSVLYNFINHPTKKLYAGAGFALNKIMSSENSLTKRFQSSSTPIYESPYRDFSNGWMTLYARAGYQINKKIEIAGSFKLKGNFYYTMKPSLLFLNINYHF